MGLALRSCPVWSFWAGRFDHLVHLSTYLLMADGHVKVILPGYCVPGASSLSKFTISLFQKVLSQPSSDPHPHLPTKPVPVPHGGERGLLAPWPSEPGLKLLTLFLQEALLLGSLAHRHCQWHDSAGGAHGEEKENGNSKVQTPPYLTGAPRDWAGFSITVMVVSVSFSGVSVSYSGIDGAGQRTERRQLSTGPHPTITFHRTPRLQRREIFGEGLDESHGIPGFQQRRPWLSTFLQVPSRYRKVWRGEQWCGW